MAYISCLSVCLLHSLNVAEVNNRRLLKIPTKHIYAVRTECRIF